MVAEMRYSWDKSYLVLAEDCGTRTSKKKTRIYQCKIFIK